MTVPEKYRLQAKLAVKDDYNYDFLEMGIEHSEAELEAGILHNIRAFLIEMSGDYTFIRNQFYLTALDETVKLPDENPSIGIIVCKSKNRAKVEYTLRSTAT